MKLSGRPSRAYISGAVWMALLAAGCMQAAEPPHKSVLALYWGGKDFPANVRFDRSLKEVFGSAGSDTVDYYAEYFETERFPGENQSLLLRDYLRRKYADRKIDVVIALSSISLDFLLKYRDDLFPHTPIVYHTFRRPNLSSADEGPGFTGVVVDNIFGNTLRVALQLHPAARKALIVVGVPEHDKELESDVRHELGEFEGKVELTYLTGLPLSHLMNRVRNAPPESIIFYVRYSLDGPANALDPYDALALVAQASPVPVYSLANPSLLRGSVGGYDFSLEECAARAAKIALRIANGARRCMAASRKMLRWNQTYAGAVIS